MMLEIYAKLHAMMESQQTGASGVVVIGVPEVCPTGSKFVLNDAGEIVAGNIDPELLKPVQEDLLNIIREKTPKILTIPLSQSAFFNQSSSINSSINSSNIAPPSGTSSALSASGSSGSTSSSNLAPASSVASLTVFLDPIYPQIRLIILGGGHIAFPLVKMGHTLGLQMTVVDDRPSFANNSRFPEAEEVICGDFVEVIRRLTIDANTYVVVVTRGHRHDEICLAEILNHPVRPAYVGMIGSRRKVMTILNDLAENGISEEVLNTVHAPIGLDIGAQTPEEIALSILAEMVMVKHYGYSSGLKNKRRGKTNHG